MLPSRKAWQARENTAAFSSCHSGGGETPKNVINFELFNELLSEFSVIIMPKVAFIKQSPFFMIPDDAVSRMWSLYF
jgi:hypothetical protein